MEKFSVIFIYIGPIAFVVFGLIRGKFASKIIRRSLLFLMSGIAAIFISIMAYGYYVSNFCEFCGSLLGEEYTKVAIALNDYFNTPGRTNLPTLEELSDSVGYIAPSEGKSPFPYNPCPQKSDLEVLILGNIDDFKIIVIDAKGKCDNMSYAGDYFRPEQICNELFVENEVENILSSTTTIKKLKAFCRDWI